VFVTHDTDIYIFSDSQAALRALDSNKIATHLRINLICLDTAALRATA